MRYLITATVAALLFLASCEKSDVMNTDGSSGQGGSLARFTIAMNHLYIVDDRTLYAYSLEAGSEPELVGQSSVGVDVETIYPFQDKLFIGSQDAMYIYSITNPARPQKLGVAGHTRACDPVIANDSLAYVTVRSSATCGGDVNAMFVYDIKDLTRPKELNRIDLKGPWGLGMKDNRLFVCDGASGLNIFDISDPVHPKLLLVNKDATFYDVIATDNLLVCMVQGGTALYEYGGADEITFKAKITN